MPRKKTSRYQLHGWTRHTESGEHLVNRLSMEFGIQSESHSNRLSNQSDSAEEAKYLKKNRS